MISPVPAPPPVRRGDRVGVAALSGVVDPGKLNDGVAELERLGFDVVQATNLTQVDAVFAGTDEERLAGFHGLAADPSIHAVFFARGGHGVLRLLDGIDWDLLKRNPRAYVGYSDLTPLLEGVVARCGWLAFHGPLVAVELARGLEARELESLKGALSGRDGGPELLPFVEAIGLEAPVEGVLRGGCLSLLSATLGTPYASDLAGSILFWEDVDEPLYRLDRMLRQLRLAGALDGVRAMVVGQSAQGRENDDWRLHQLLGSLQAQLGMPMVYGCESGHTTPNLTLPLGRRVRLDPERRCLLLP